MTERGARAVKAGGNDYKYHFACHLKKSEEQRDTQAARSGIALEQKSPARKVKKPGKSEKKYAVDLPSSTGEVTGHS